MERKIVHSRDHGITAPAAKDPHAAGGKAASGTGPMPPFGPTGYPFLGIGPIDMRCILIAVVCGLFSYVLASLSLSLGRFGDGALATVWLPAACTAAFLLRVPLKNEMLYLLALFLGIFAADIAAGFSLGVSVLFAAANLAEVAVMVALVRRFCGPQPAMTNLNHLAIVVWFGALVAPLASSLVALAAIMSTMGLTGTALIEQVINWHIAHALGIILIVPAVLLLADLWRGPGSIDRGTQIEASALILLGLIASYLVFEHADYSLLFLILPITLLLAFRLGALGTSLFVAGLTMIAAVMTSAGLGPIYEASGSSAIRNHLLQAFIAANFLTGLPVAAALAGRKRMIDALEQGKQQLGILAENISDAVLHYGPDGICTYASPSVRRVLGEDPSRFVGARFSEKIHEDARDRIVEAEHRLLSGESAHERFTYRRFLDSEDSTPVFIEAECAIASDDQSGSDNGIVVAARDVTARVELELLLTRSRRHAENAARAKSEFLANMSHEIRTPMNGVLGFAELILQSDLDEDQRRQAQMIVQSGRSMMMLLNDVLDLSRIEAGQIAIDNAPVDLDTTISECAALHEPAAFAKGLDLVFERPCEGHENQSAEDAEDAGAGTALWVMTDALRLRQIILNLIGNAVKFTESGSVTISYHMRGDEVAIAIADTGIGISEGRLGMIFRPFTQAEGDTARRFGGTGLGLSISRQLAELLGGEIDVTSTVGAGSCFTITLPAICVSPETGPEPEPEPAPPLLEDLPHQARILLAEDHDVNRMLAREMLERCGQTVAAAHDGNEAISMVMDSFVRGSPYDLVLMDMQMPGCDGYEATRAIRAEGITPDDLPIVALTANAFPEDIAAARKAGMQAHLAKPLVFADLARVLQRWLPTRIIDHDSESDKIAANGVMQPLDGHDLGPDRSEVVDLLHAARSQNARPSSPDVAASFSALIAGNSAKDPAKDASEDQGRKSSSAMPAHSPALIKRWLIRREEAVEAVRSALGEGLLSAAGSHDLAHDDTDSLAEERAALGRIIHKLAGTAAMFGEPELGDQALALEHAITMQLDPRALEALALELLNLADAHAEAVARSAR